MNPPSTTKGQSKSFEEVLAQSPRSHSALLLLVMLLSGIIFRFFAVPWDFGGFFFQTWISLVGTAGYAAALTFLKAPLKQIVGFALFLIVAFCSIGTLYFAPQALFPFLFFGGALALGAWFASEQRFRYAWIAFLLLIPLGGYCLYGGSAVAEMMKFRALSKEGVQAIQFKNPETKQIISIEDLSVQKHIIDSLSATTPYSPNHEGIHDPWDVSILTANGRTIQFRVGNGNRSHAEAAWISFAEAVYKMLN